VLYAIADETSGVENAVNVGCLAASAPITPLSLIVSGIGLP